MNYFLKQPEFRWDHVSHNEENRSIETKVVRGILAWAKPAFFSRLYAEMKMEGEKEYT